MQSIIRQCDYICHENCRNLMTECMFTKYDIFKHSIHCVLWRRIPTWGEFYTMKYWELTD